MNRGRVGMALATWFVSAGVAGSGIDGLRQAIMQIDSLINIEKTNSYGSVASTDVRGAIAAAAKATGVDFAYLAANASLESSLDPAAKAKTSSAAGLYQFIESTWGQMVERHGAKIGLGKEAAALSSGDLSSAERRRIMDLRFDPGVSARLGAEFASENKTFLKEALGQEPEDVDLYLAHFLGAGGAAKFLDRMEAAPKASAADVFPAAAKANRSVFYDGARERSFTEIRDGFADKLTARAGDILKTPRHTAPVAEAAEAAERITTPLTVTRRAPPALGGDPWLSTLVTAQMTMNDSLLQSDRGGDRGSRSLI